MSLLLSATPAMGWRIRCLVFVLLDLALKGTSALTVGHEGIKSSGVPSTNLIRDTSNNPVPPTFDVSVRNSNGTDISREIPILHQFSTVSLPPSTSKRDLSSPQNDCPLPSWPVFEGSVCLRQTSPQALLATCRHQTDLFDFKNVHSHCADNEICVDGIRAKAGFATQEVYMAYCVNTENFIRIIQDHTTTWSAAESVEVNTNSNDYAIEAVMTGLDHKTSVFAEFLNIQSQVYDTSKNYATWRSLPNGNDNCHNCASVQIQPIPAGTQRIRVDVVLNTVKAAGLLYLATIASS